MKKLKYITLGLALVAVVLFYSCADLTPPYGGWLWVVTNEPERIGKHHRGGIMRLDPSTGETVDEYLAPASWDGDNLGLAFGNGLVWVGWEEGDPYQGYNWFIKWLDPSTGNEGEPVELEHTPSGLTWAGNELWGIRGHYLYRINVITGELDNEIELNGGVISVSGNGLAWDGSYFWATNGYTADEKTICKIDPKSGEVLKHIKAPCEHPVGLAWDGGALWVNDEENRYAYRVSPKDGDVLGSYYYPFDSGQFPYGLAFEFPDGTGN